jgi:hypothetical protein
MMMEPSVMIILGIVFVVLVIAFTETIGQRQEAQSRITELEDAIKETIGLITNHENIENDYAKIVIAWQDLSLSLEKELARKLHRKTRTLEQLREII